MLSCLWNIPEHSAGLALDTLSSWWVMPGWAAATEALYRSEPQHPTDLVVVCQAARAVWKSTALLRAPNSTTNLCERLSLASTLNKLLWPHIQREMHDPVRGWQCMRNASKVEQERWADKQKEKLFSVNDGLAQILADAVLALDCLIANSSKDGNGSSSGSSSQGKKAMQIHSSKEISGRAVRVTESKAEDPTQGAGTGGRVTHGELSMKTSLHRLLTRSLIMLVQIALWFQECQQTRAGSHFRREVDNWLHRITGVCDQLQHTHLKAVVTSLLCESPSTPISQQEVSLAWERYAVTHFHGRLTSGCCHLGCSNFSGASEAALKTRLCGGCRKARYCSLRCQTNAWIKGGHSGVCGS